MTDDLTAGEFQAATGLSAKALRLYAERAILTPASVDAVTGYRSYGRDQLREGMTLDLLRRARVPLAELEDGAGLDVDAWRQTVALRRLQEDFHLDVAERVAAFDPADLVAHRTQAAAIDWVGVVVVLDVPDDVEDRVPAFAAMSVDVSAVEGAFAAVLADLGAAPAAVSWTAVPDGARGGGARMVLARPGGPLDAPTRELVVDRVSAASGTTVAVTSGTLPDRDELTFARAAGGELTLVEEAALGYLELLAAEDHVQRHGLRVVRPSARQVVRGPSVFTDGRPVSVFDLPRG